MFIIYKKRQKSAGCFTKRPLKNYQFWYMINYIPRKQEVQYMDRIIRQILQIDADAQQKLQDAYRRREELISKADKEAEEEAEKLRRHCEEKIEAIRATEQQTAEDEIRQIRENADRQVVALEKEFAAMEPVWLNEIVQSIIG